MDSNPLALVFLVAIVISNIILLYNLHSDNPISTFWVSILIGGSILVFIIKGLMVNKGKNKQ